MRSILSLVVLLTAFPIQLLAQQQAVPPQPVPSQTPTSQQPAGQQSAAQAPPSQANGNAQQAPKPPGGAGNDDAYGYFGYKLEQTGDPNSTVYQTANTNTTNVTLPADPDVHLNATVHVGEIKLEVLNITAKVNLDAQVKGLLKFNAGVNAHIDRVMLLIQGVEARVLLEARLGNLVAIVSDVLDSLDLNPIIAALANSVNTIVNTTVGELTGNSPKQNQKLQARSMRIENNILYSVNDYSGNTHTNRILDQNGEIVEEYLDNQGQRHGTNVVGHYERDMRFNGHDFPMSRNGEEVREREYVYEPFPGLSVVSAVYINGKGKVVGTQVIAESFGGGSSSVETLTRRR